MCHGERMAHVLLLHSALGLRSAVHEFAADLRDLGHTVETPDYYDGHVFDSERDGIAYRDEVGVPTLMKRAKGYLAGLPEDAVLGGFSLGAFFAQAFAAKRPDARAALLLHSVAPPQGEWNGVPVQVHRYAEDHWIDEPDVAALRDAVEASGASFEDIVVPGRGHLFTDPGTPDGNADATRTSLERIAALLNG